MQKAYQVAATIGELLVFVLCGVILIAAAGTLL